MAYTSYYSFGQSSFVNYVSLAGGALFQNPTTLEVEMTIAGDYHVEVRDTGGALVAKSVTRDNPNGGWEYFDFRGGGGGEFLPPLAEGSYSIRLVNDGSGTRLVRGGLLSMRLHAGRAHQGRMSRDGRVASLT